MDQTSIQCKPYLSQAYLTRSYNICIYRQNTTIFISSIMGVYYNTHKYMFRPLMLAIFRLYMDLSSSYTTYVGCFFRVWGKGFFVRSRSRLCQRWVHGLELYHWITNDTVPDHGPTFDTNEISVPHKITLPPHPKKHYRLVTHAV